MRPAVVYPLAEVQVMREVTLPSGAVLKVGLAPFGVAKKLQQAMLRELRHIGVGMVPDMGFVPELLKNAFCTAYSSAEVEQAMKLVIIRSTYNDEKIDLDNPTMFEPVEARADYYQVLAEVAKDNVGPFMSWLYAEWKRQTSAKNTEPPKS